MEHQDHNVDRDIHQQWVDYYTAEIKGLFCGIEPGLAIVIGMTGAVGSSLDATKMAAAFSKRPHCLGFGVLHQNNLPQHELLALIDAASQYSYYNEERECNFKAIVFYFSGHGGADINTGKPFVQCGDQQTVLIDDIVCPFYPKNTRGIPKDAKRLFFFDMCLSQVHDADPAQAMPETLPRLDVVPPEGNCLVAYATSLNSTSAGDRKNGGYWTRHLHNNIIEDWDIFKILAKTWEETVAYTSEEEGKYGVRLIQGPYLTACMGSFNLTSLTNKQNRARLQAPPLIASQSRVATDGDVDDEMMMKPPRIRDLVVWLKDIKNQWKLLGQQLKIPETELQSIQISLSLSSPTEKLSEVFNQWERRDVATHTFKKLIESLERMEGTEGVIKTIKGKLQDQEVVQEYS